MSEHTPGKWVADGTVIYADIGIQPHIAYLDGLTDQPEANARRIVACVNACEGMDDPQIGISKMCYEPDKARQERDQAEAENARLREALESIAKNGCCDHCQEAARVARAALGKE
jgi:hypothetical protein